jgi:hypothetical protein
VSEASDGFSREVSADILIVIFLYFWHFFVGLSDIAYFEGRVFADFFCYIFQFYFLFLLLSWSFFGWLDAILESLIEGKGV